MFLQYLRDSQTKSLQHCCRLISEVHCQGWKVLHELLQKNNTKILKGLWLLLFEQCLSRILITIMSPHRLALEKILLLQMILSGNPSIFNACVTHQISVFLTSFFHTYRVLFSLYDWGH